MIEEIRTCLWTEGGKSSIKGREEGRKEGRRCIKEGNYQSNIFSKRHFAKSPVITVDALDNDHTVRRVGRREVNASRHYVVIVWECGDAIWSAVVVVVVIVYENEFGQGDRQTNAWPIALAFGIVHVIGMESAGADIRFKRKRDLLRVSRRIVRCHLRRLRGRSQDRHD